MLDFRQNTNGRKNANPLGRRWLVAMILLLGAVFVVFEISREPGAWQWLDKLTETSEDAPAEGVDNRLPAMSQDDLARDSFVIGKPESDEATAGRKKDLFPGVDAGLLDSVRDNTFFSSADQSPSLQLLDVLKRTNQRELRDASEGPVTYAQLFRQPAHYRGRLVTISGTVRRVRRIELPKNSYDIGHYYEVWLFPKILPPSPILVYALRLPEGFPSDGQSSEEAEITGFFFKRCAYQSADGLRTAPTILCKTLQWQKRPAPVEKPAVDGRSIILVAAGAALLAALTAWYVYMRTRPTRFQLPDRPPNFDLIKEMDQRNETGDES